MNQEQIVKRRERNKSLFLEALNEVCKERDLEEKVVLGKFQERLKSIPSQEADVIQQRISGDTFVEISKHLGMTPERTRQIFLRGMRRLKQSRRKQRLADFIGD